MASQVMRIILKGYEHQLVDNSAAKIVDTVKKAGAKVSGPVPLPTKREVVTILRAVHKYKDSREQFEQRTHKRLIDVVTPSQKTVDALSRLELPPGVHIDIKMKKAILTTKVGMTQIFNENGVLVPVTVLKAGPCVVTQIKTEENDGYNSVQVAYGEIRSKLVNKAKAGHLDKAGVEKLTVKKGDGQREIYVAGRFIKEFKFDNSSEYSVKDEIKADIFAVGDKVDVSAISKGKGFQGAIKRHGQHRGPMAHGSKFHRHQGSNGSTSSPSRVFKGKGMPGHMGSKKITTQNLEIVKVDAENNLLLVKGAVPGAKKALVTVREAVKARA